MFRVLLFQYNIRKMDLNSMILDFLRMRKISLIIVNKSREKKGSIT